MLAFLIKKIAHSTAEKKKFTPFFSRTKYTIYKFKNEPASLKSIFPKLDVLAFNNILFLFTAPECDDSMSLGRQMTSDFSSSRILVGSEFTVTCNAGYTFFKGSSGSYITSSTKVGTCNKKYYDGKTYYKWEYGGSSEVGDCDRNYPLLIIHNFFIPDFMVQEFNTLN